MDKLISIAVFLGVGLGFVLVNMLVGRLVRPSLPHAEKQSIYECGEPTVGSSWVQFDLRFYIVALFFLVFDVEVALIYPWAVIFREFPREAMILGTPFVGLVVVGFAYEWRTGSLDWVRGTVHTSVKNMAISPGMSTAKLARLDPEALEDRAAQASSRSSTSSSSQAHL